MKKGKLVVVPTTSFYETIMQYVDSIPKTSHMGYHKTLHRAKLDFYCLGMRKDVKWVVRECQTCQVNKVETVLPTGL